MEIQLEKDHKSLLCESALVTAIVGILLARFTIELSDLGVFMLVATILCMSFGVYAGLHYYKDGGSLRISITEEGIEIQKPSDKQIWYLENNIEIRQGRSFFDSYWISISDDRAIRRIFLGLKPKNGYENEFKQLLGAIT